METVGLRKGVYRVWHPQREGIMLIAKDWYKDLGWNIRYEDTGNFWGGPYKTLKEAKQALADHWDVDTGGAKST